MADLINKANTTGTAYVSATGHTSTSYWTYAFGDCIYFSASTLTASSMWEKHPNLSTEFWRYSISQQIWIQVGYTSMGKSNTTVYRVRCDVSPDSYIGNSYDGDDSYLFAFKAHTTQGERSRCRDHITVFNIGETNSYDTTIKGGVIYGRSLDEAYRFHRDSSGYSALTLTDPWLTTDGLQGTQITTALKPRMISVKSAISKT